MRRPAIVIFAILLLWCGAAVADVTLRQPEQIPAGKTLTLEDCINLALRNQSLIRQAAAQVDVGSGVVMQSRSKLLPSTSVTASTDVANSTGARGTQVTAGASQLIYDFQRSRLGLTESERQKAASAANLNATSADVIFNVKQAYYSLLQTTHLVYVFTDQLKAQEASVAQAQAQKTAGVAPLADVLTAQAAAASAQVDLITAQNSADQARVTLNAAMGVDIQSPTTITETSEPAPPVLDEKQLVDIALARRPEVLQNSELVSASEAALRLQKTGNLPALTTSVDDGQAINAGGGGGGGQGSGDQNSWTWTLNLQWTPYDSGFTAGGVRQARAELVSAQEALYAERQTVTQDVIAALLSAKAADQQYTAAQAEVASARQNLDVATGQYQAGVGIYLNVLNAHAAMLKAEVDEYTAEYGLSTARAALEHAVGGTIIEGGRS